MNWFFRCLLHYAVTDGRSSRKEYWMFVLFFHLFGIAMNVLDMMFGTTLYDFGGVGYICITYLFAMIIPAITVTVRRLHDVGKNGLNLFFLFIPVAGALWLLHLVVKQGEPGVNRYGINPELLPEPQY